MNNITFENYKKYVGKKVEVDIFCYAAGIMYPEDNILIGMNPGIYYFYSQEDDHYWHWDVVDGKGGKDWSIEVGFDGGAVPQIEEKIYVVTDGNYSDYRIMGVFDSKEKAELYIDSFYGRIEEYVLNPYNEELKNGFKSFAVYMNINGSTEKYGIKCGNGSTNDNSFFNYYGDDEIYLIANMWAKDEQHAIKIANERRVQYIANNTWGIDKN